MKKWSALLLAAFVFTIGPSVILAQEPAKPEKPKGLLTTVLTILTKSVESQTNSVSGANNLQADKDEVKKQDAPSTLPSSTPVQPSSAVVHILDGTQKTSPISESSVSNADKGAVSNSSVSATAQPPVKTEEIKPEVPAMTKEIRTQNKELNSNSVSEDHAVNLNAFSKYSQQIDSKEESTENLLSAAVSLPVIGTANLDLLSRSGLLNVDLKGSILGDTHLGIAEITSIESLNYKENYFGLINADIINPILGEDHIGVLEFHQIETAEGTTVSGGLVIADLNDSLLGDAHIGVGEFGSLDPPNPSVPTENPTGEIPIQNKPSSPGKPARPPDLNNTGINQGNISVEDKSTQYFSSFDESMQSADRLAPVAELSAVLTNAGNKDGSHQQSEKELASLKKLAEANVNGLTNSVIQMALLQNAPSGNSSSSGSGSGSSSSGSGGSGADSILDSAYDAELGIETNVQIILQEMADEWIKAPPIKPPQATFFLS